jgi:hypothetical protein
MSYRQKWPYKQVSLSPVRGNLFTSGGFSTFLAVEKQNDPMKLIFSKNIQFTRLIKVNGKLKEFNFRKPNNDEGSLFTVDVINEQAQRIIFSMQKNEAGWKIITPAIPGWIEEKETELNEIITEELKKLEQ